MSASYNSFDKDKEQSLLLCIVLNLGVSKLPATIAATSFYVLINLSIIGCHKDAFAMEYSNQLMLL